MSVDTRKLKEKATEAWGKKNFAKAAEFYSEYCNAEQQDLQARLRMGDAWVKCGQKDKAILAYQFAAQGFAQDGFLPRAIAASKLILELDPAHKGVQKMLADLYARKSGGAGGAVARNVAGVTGVQPNNKHAPIDLPRVEDVPFEIEESGSFKRRAIEPAPSPVPKSKPVEPPKPIDLHIEPAKAAEASKPKGPLSSPPPPQPPKRATQEIAVITVDDVFDPELAKKQQLKAVLDHDLPAKQIELPGEHFVPPPPPPPSAPQAYDLEMDEVAPVQGVPELSELQKAEESGRIKRTSSGAYELDLDDGELEGFSTAKAAEPPPPPPPRPPPPEDAPGEMTLSKPVELTTKKKPRAPEIDEAKLVAELAIPEASAPLIPVASSSASAPPGLRAKRHGPDDDDEPAITGEPVESASPAAPQPPGSRIWFPNNVVASSPEESQRKQFTSPLRGGPETDLERSLAAFSAFDDAAAGVAATASPQEPQLPQPPPPPPPRVANHTFTELELEGDSLLHAVETAADIGQAQRGEDNRRPIEEVMEAPEEPVRPGTGALPKIPLFSDLPEDAFIALFERCPLRRFEPTELIIQQGTLGDSFFVICAGAVKVYRLDGDQRRDIATLNEGAFFGEMALLSGAARTASVEAATEDTQLLEISAPVLTELSHKHPTVAQALKKFCRQRLLTNVMSSSALFAPFSRTERRQLVEKFRARDVKKGDLVIREGHKSDGMYIVLSGEIEVRLGVHAVATLHEGDVFGEMSLLTKSPATASCAASRHTSLLRLPVVEFENLVKNHPQVLVLVSELTDERKKQNATHASRATTATAGEATPMV